MKQTKLSKQQKKIIMLLGERYDSDKKRGEKYKGWIERITLKRQATNTPGGALSELFREGKTKDYKPMTNSANASVTRSLKSLKERGLLHPGSGTEQILGYTYALNNEGLQVYKDLKKTK